MWSPTGPHEPDAFLTLRRERVRRERAARRRLRMGVHAAASGLTSPATRRSCSSRSSGFVQILQFTADPQTVCSCRQALIGAPTSRRPLPRSSRPPRIAIPITFAAHRRKHVPGDPSCAPAVLPSSRTIAPSADPSSQPGDPVVRNGPRSVSGCGEPVPVSAQPPPIHPGSAQAVPLRRQL